MEAGRKLVAGKERLDGEWWQEEGAKGSARAGLAQQGPGQSLEPGRGDEGAGQQGRHLAGRYAMGCAHLHGRQMCH